MTSPTPALVNTTSQLAASMPGFDPTAAINAGDKGLTDYLAMPTQQILDKLGLQQIPSVPSAAAAAAGAPANPGGSINAVDPTQLISPVANALGTLGNPQLSEMPATALNGISSAVDTISGPVQQALRSVQQGWQGVSSAAAAAKTTAALANGAEVATQATGLQNSLTAAAADVAQARVQLIAIINEFFATLAAIGPNIIFPWGWAAVVAAAAHAVAQTSQVMAEVQSSLAAQASAVTAIGKPVAVTAAPTGASSAAAINPLASMMGSASGLNMLSPLMSVASMGISPMLSAVSMAANPAAAAGAQSATLAHRTATDPKSAAGGAAPAGKGGAGGAPVLRAGGGGGTPGALVSRLTGPMPLTSAETTATTMSAGSARPATAAVPMGGGGMMGAPLAGATNAGSAHSAASYLHTSDQGGKVFGDRNTVAPPVIGEADPNDVPDIELRI